MRQCTLAHGRDETYSEEIGKVGDAGSQVRLRSSLSPPLLGKGLAVATSNVGSIVSSSDNESGSENQDVEFVLLARLASQTRLGDGIDGVGDHVDVGLIETGEVSLKCSLDPAIIGRRAKRHVQDP